MKSCIYLCCGAGFPRVPAAMKLRLHFVVDPMGWLCISVVFGIWLYNTFFIPKLVLHPHYNEGHIPWAIVVCEYPCSPSAGISLLTHMINNTCQRLGRDHWVKALEFLTRLYGSHTLHTLCIPSGYYIASALCIAALFRASTADPGRLPVDPHIPHSGRDTPSINLYICKYLNIVNKAFLLPILYDWGTFIAIRNIIVVISAS